ncbi:hypothetical protein, partial [Enterococcus faecalis]|uniref:hypothetical protein n=1 Tax=Enterococcus faecalis TaxID=1351 RepID=UPI00403F915D
MRDDICAKPPLPSQWEESDRLCYAVGRLEHLDPSLSARTGLWPTQRLALAGLAGLALAALILAPFALVTTLHALLA